MWFLLPILMAASIVDASGVTVAKPPRGPKGDGGLITDGDYPKGAKVAREQGVGVYAYRVGVEGTVDDCRTVQSAGFADLDDAACTVLRNRVRFSKPAEGTDGKPAPFWGRRTVHWRLP